MCREKTKRKKKLAMILGAAILAGITASFVMIKTGYHLPCLFRSITGYLCPGCGATRMFLSLFQMDIKSAFHSNMLLFLSMPFILFILAEMMISYIKTGKMVNSGFSRKTAGVLVAAFLIFGIWRNII